MKRRIKSFTLFKESYLHEFEDETQLPDELDIELVACSSCSIWLKPIQMKQDLDGYPICENCLAHYGP